MPARFAQVITRREVNYETPSPAMLVITNITSRSAAQLQVGLTEHRQCPILPGVAAMTAEGYIRAVLGRYELPTGPDSPAEKALTNLEPYIREWAGRYLVEILPTGSYAKATRILGGTDIDILISLSYRTPRDASQLYEHFFLWLKRHDFKPRRHPVSIAITHQGLEVHLLPARQEHASSAKHQLYATERRRVTTTNLSAHVKFVTGSRRTVEIKVIKLWRMLHELRFPSFYLELAVIDALRQRPYDLLAGNIEVALRYLADVFPGVPFRDPANPDNRVSDDLLEHEKLAIADAARRTLLLSDWSKVIW